MCTSLWFPRGRKQDRSPPVNYRTLQGLGTPAQGGQRGTQSSSGRNTATGAAEQLGKLKEIEDKLSALERQMRERGSAPITPAAGGHGIATTAALIGSAVALLAAGYFYFAGTSRRAAEQKEAENELEKLRQRQKSKSD